VPGRGSGRCAGCRARGKDRRACFGNEAFPGHGEFVFAFKNLERLVFSAVDMRGWTAARQIVRFDNAYGAVGITSIHPDKHGDTQDVDGFAAINWNFNWIHVGIWRDG
jgi:hypothetical protein